MGMAGRRGLDCFILNVFWGTKRTRKGGGMNE